jgi:hypothetical protein
VLAVRGRGPGSAGGAVCRVGCAAVSLWFSGSYAAARDLSAQIADAHRDSRDYCPEHPDTLAARGNLAF